MSYSFSWDCTLPISNIHDIVSINIEPETKNYNEGNYLSLRGKIAVKGTYVTNDRSTHPFSEDIPLDIILPNNGKSQNIRPELESYECEVKNGKELFLKVNLILQGYEFSHGSQPAQAPVQNQYDPYDGYEEEDAWEEPQQTIPSNNTGDFNSWNQAHTGQEFQVGSNQSSDFSSWQAAQQGFTADPYEGLNEENNGDFVNYDNSDCTDSFESYAPYLGRHEHYVPKPAPTPAPVVKPQHPINDVHESHTFTTGQQTATPSQTAVETGNHPAAVQQAPAAPHYEQTVTTGPVAYPSVNQHASSTLPQATEHVSNQGQAHFVDHYESGSFGHNAEGTHAPVNQEVAHQGYGHATVGESAHHLGSGGENYQFGGGGAEYVHPSQTGTTVSEVVHHSASGTEYSQAPHFTQSGSAEYNLGEGQLAGHNQEWATHSTEHVISGLQPETSWTHTGETVTSLGSTTHAGGMATEWTHTGETVTPLGSASHTGDVATQWNHTGETVTPLSNWSHTGETTTGWSQTGGNAGGHTNWTQAGGNEAGQTSWAQAGGNEAGHTSWTQTGESTAGHAAHGGTFSGQATHPTSTIPRKEYLQQVFQQGNQVHSNPVQTASNQQATTQEASSIHATNQGHINTTANQTAPAGYAANQQAFEQGVSGQASHSATGFQSQQQGFVHEASPAQVEYADGGDYWGQTAQGTSNQVIEDDSDQVDQVFPFVGGSQVEIQAVPQTQPKSSIFSMLGHLDEEYGTDEDELGTDGMEAMASNEPVLLQSTDGITGGNGSVFGNEVISYYNKKLSSKKNATEAAAAPVVEAQQKAASYYDSSVAKQFSDGASVIKVIFVQEDRTIESFCAEHDITEANIYNLGDLDSLLRAGNRVVVNYGRCK
ncbi:MAG: hypothetical protein FWF59_05820 [Turicibacter sp.]|nr:hypothetical protein [Turicibacter sp.]